MSARAKAEGKKEGGPKEGGKEKESGGVEAVDRALSILSAFHDADRLTLAELSRATGLYKSTLLRLAASLERCGFLRRLPDKSFALGSETYRLGARYQQAFKLEEVVRPTLRRLLEKTGESASFFVRDRDRRLCLFREHSSHPVRDHVSEGETLPLEFGAAGRVLSAFEDPDRLGGPDGEEAFAALPLFSFGERVPDVSAAAVPVYRLEEARPRLSGVLAISGPSIRFSADRVEIIRRSLLEEGRRLSQALGAPWPPSPRVAA